jgi:large subunit ribosomal protein L10
MPTEAKKAAVAALKEDLSASTATIVADYRGLTVSEMGAVRRALRGEGITYRVVKNRLAKIAAHEAGNDELTELLDGPTALAMGGGDEVVLARTFLDAIRPYRTVAVRGAVLNGRRVDADSVTRLAALPSREVLLAQLAGGIASPLASMASLLAAPLRNLGYALSQLAERRGEQVQAAAPEAPPVETEPAETSAAASVEAETPAPEAEQAESSTAEATPGAPEAAETSEAETADDKVAGDAAAEPETATDDTDESETQPA